jgi:hypothetical protein
LYTAGVGLTLRHASDHDIVGTLLHASPAMNKAVRETTTDVARVTNAIVG